MSGLCLAVEITYFGRPFRAGLGDGCTLCSPSGGKTDGPLSQRAWAVAGDDVHSLSKLLTKIKLSDRSFSPAFPGTEPLASSGSSVTGMIL
jgi:hypothetical protein